jgi:hypothetical protein
MLRVIYAKCHLLSVANKPIMLSVIILNAVMLSVVMVNVVASKVHLTSLQYFFLSSLTLLMNKLECLDGWAFLSVANILTLFGTTTLSIMTLSITTLSIMISKIRHLA